MTVTFRSAGISRPFSAVEPAQQLVRHDDRVRAGALGERQTDRGRPVPGAVRAALVHPDAMLLRARTDHDRGDVAHIDRAIVARGHQQQADVRDAGQGLAGRDRARRAGVAHLAGEERAVGVAHLGDELLQRDAVQRELLGIGLDADLLRAAAGDIGEADIVDLHQLGAQLVGDLIEILVGPALGDLGLGRQRQHDDRNVVDAAADDQRLRDSDRNPVHVGAHLLVDPQDRILGLGADEKARRHHHAVVLRLAVDVLDAVDALDDRFERLGDQLDRVRAP